MKKEKMLVYANYFYPEVASLSQLLTELCENLVNDFDITVICSVPCYTGKIEEKYKKGKYFFEKYDDINIIRVSVPECNKTNKLSRIKHILVYFFRAIKATFKVGKMDIVYTVSQPPILGGILGFIGKKITKGKLVYNIQDFNPEQIIAVNYSKNKLLLKLLLIIDKFVCRKTDLIIVVGRDMKETLIKRFKNKKIPNTVVINNWINEESVYPLAKNNKKVIAFKKKYQLDNKFIIMYSGNIGLFYDLEKLITIFEKYKNNDDIVFAIIGEGAIKNKLIDYCNDHQMNNIRFIPYQDKKDLVYSLNAADIHLVTNSKGIKGVSVPSKIYGCLATNIPILGILEKGSEAWKIIEDSNCGVVVDAGDYEKIDNILNEIVVNKNEFVSRHLTGRKYLENNLTKDKSIEKYKRELKKIVKS